MNYARRNGVEDGLGTNVDFFHMDNLSSEVRLNVDLDVTLTVIANGCYRWLASRLKGFEKAKIGLVDSGQGFPLPQLEDMKSSLPQVSWQNCDSIA